MKTDERLKRALNQSSSKGFFIWYILLLIALLYRQFWLKQDIKDFIDIGVIFFIGTLYVFISYLNNGVFGEKPVKRIIPIIIGAAAGIIIVVIFVGKMSSFEEISGLIIGILIFIAIFIPFVLYLNAKWKRKNMIE